jgi:deoxycytidylate deaminase
MVVLSTIGAKFGVVITKNNRIVSTGYNGTPSQFLNCNQGGCERCRNRIEGKIKTGEQLEKCLYIHAEASAILQNSKECQGSTLHFTGELVSNALNLFYQLESKESSVWRDSISIMEYSF